MPVKKNKKQKKKQKKPELLKSTTDESETPLWGRPGLDGVSPSTGGWPAGRRATGWLAGSPVDQWGHPSVDQGQVHLLVDQSSAGCCPGGRSLWDEMFPPWPHIAEDHGCFWFFLFPYFVDFIFPIFISTVALRCMLNEHCLPVSKFIGISLLYLSTCLTTPTESTWCFRELR